MELIIIITAICICLSAMLTPSSSLQIQLQQSSHQQAHEERLLLLPALPRKLRFTEEVTFQEHAVQHTAASHTEHAGVPSGKAGQKEQVMKHGSRGTWQEWMERTDSSQFFTMDYSHVRRRRPIHNKSLPVGP